MAMALHTLANNLALKDIERREQRGDAMARLSSWLLGMTAIAPFWFEAGCDASELLEIVMADTAYDADHLRQAIAARPLELPRRRHSACHHCGGEKCPHHLARRYGAYTGACVWLANCLFLEQVFLDFRA
jgi:hypothetical protein